MCLCTIKIEQKEAGRRERPGGRGRWCSPKFIFQLRQEELKSLHTVFALDLQKPTGALYQMSAQNNPALEAKVSLHLLPQFQTPARSRTITIAQSSSKNARSQAETVTDWHGGCSCLLILSHTRAHARTHTHKHTHARARASKVHAQGQSATTATRSPLSFSSSLPPDGKSCLCGEYSFACQVPLVWSPWSVENGPATSPS